MKKGIIPLCAAAGLVACSTPKVTRYYKSEKGTRTITSKETIDSLFAIHAFVLDPSVGATQTITNLSDKGQGALIEALNSKTKSSEELIGALASSLEETASPGASRGSITWKKRVVIHIAKMDKEPANRLQQLWLTLEIPDSLKSKVSFVSWDKIITETQTYDLGKITSSSTAGFSFSPQVTMAGYVQGSLPGVASGSSTYGAEKSFTAKMPGLTAAVADPTKFVMLREALPNENISGNIVIEFTLKSALSNEDQIHDFSGFYNGTTLVTDQSKIELVRSLMIKPDFGKSTIVPVDVTYEFHYRTVGKGKKTGPEYDDHITYFDGKHTDLHKFNLFNTAEIKPSTWRIWDGSSYLNISNTKQKNTLLFSSYNKALKFIEWLTLTKNLEVASYKLLLDSRNLSIDDIQKLTVKLAE